MTAMEIIIGIVLMILSVLVILLIMFQEGKQTNMSAISGAADSFFDKGGARTRDAILAKWTKIMAVVFFVLVAAGMFVTKFLGA